MKQWFLGRGQTLISLVVVVALVWGLVVMVLKLLSIQHQNDTITALVVVLVGAVTSLVAVATALGKSLFETPKGEEKK